MIKIFPANIIIYLFVLFFSIYRYNANYIPIEVSAFIFVIIFLLFIELKFPSNTPICWVWINIYFLGFVPEALSLPRGLPLMFNNWIGMSPLYSSFYFDILSKVFITASIMIMASYSVLKISDYLIGKIHFEKINITEKSLIWRVSFISIISIIISIVLDYYNAAKVGNWNAALPIFGIPKLYPILVSVIDCVIPSFLFYYIIVLGIKFNLKLQHMILPIFSLLIDSITRGSRGYFIIKTLFLIVFFLFYKEKSQQFFKLKKQLIFGLLFIISIPITIIIGNYMRYFITGGVTGIYYYDSNQMYQFISGRLGMLDLAARAIDIPKLSVNESLLLMNPLGVFFPTFTEGFQRLVDTTYVSGSDISSGFSLYIPVIFQSLGNPLASFLVLLIIFSAVSIIINKAYFEFKLILIIQFWIILWYWYNGMMQLANLYILGFFVTSCIFIGKRFYKKFNEVNGVLY